MGKWRKLNRYKFLCREKSLGHMLLIFRILEWPKKLSPYENAIFKNGNFTILITDSDSSQKSVWRNCSPFFKILSRSSSKIQKYPFFEGKLNLPSIFMVFYIFNPLPVWILKKEEQFLYTLFWEESKSVIRLVKKAFFKIDISIGRVSFWINFPQTRCPIKNLRILKTYCQGTFLPKKICRHSIFIFCYALTYSAAQINCILFGSIRTPLLLEQIIKFLDWNKALEKIQW